MRLDKLKSTTINQLAPGSRCIVHDGETEILGLVIKHETRFGFIGLVNIITGVQQRPANIRSDDNVRQWPALDVTASTLICVDAVRVSSPHDNAIVIPGSVILQDANAYFVTGSPDAPTRLVDINHGILGRPKDDQCHVAWNWAIAAENLNGEWEYKFKFDARGEDQTRVGFQTR
jgi:hypothetical protein